MYVYIYIDINIYLYVYIYIYIYIYIYMCVCVCVYIRRFAKAGWWQAFGWLTSVGSADPRPLAHFAHTVYQDLRVAIRFRGADS